MKKFIYFAIGIATMLMAASCEKDAFNSASGEGGFSLALSINNKETLTSRAETTNDIIAKAKVDIYKPNFQGLIRSYTYSQMEDVVYLPTGNGYRVDVIAGEAAEAAPVKANFVSKSYKGSADFNIVANQITENVRVTAKISNAITNVSFDETIGQNFKDGYKLTFALADLTKADAPVADDDKLVYNATQTGEGYFIVDNPILENKLYWVFEGTKKDDTPFTAKGVIEATDATDNSLVGTRHTMNFKYVVKDGTLIFTLVVDSNTITQQDNIVWAPTSTGLSTIKNKDIWATFVTINADVDTKEYDGDVYIQYRKKSDADWVNPEDASATKIKATGDDKGVFSAVITNLDPATEYQCRLVVYDTVTADDNTTSMQWVESVVSEKEFTTAKAQQVPNASFEDRYEYDGYYVFNPQNYGFNTYSPSGEPGNKHTWWGTGNQDAVVTKVKVTTPSTDVPHTENGNSKSVCMTSDYVVVKFAAGNIYSGYFSELLGTSGGVVHFGRTTAADGSAFESRPTGVSFYARYKGVKVDNTADGVKFKTDYDEGQIKFAVGNWSNKTYKGSKESPVAVNTTDKKTFYDLSTIDGTVAYCDKIFYGDGNDTGWMKVTLKFDYKDINTIPTHIIISAASSRYGDYFAGGDGSTLYIDDIQLLYDYVE